MDHLLVAEGIKVHFGGVRAVDGVDLFVDDNETLGIIGPNGSGKTTFFNALTGIYKPTAGKFIYRGKDITGCNLHDITKIGIARTFQNIRIFKSLTVKENVLLGDNINIHTGFCDSIFHTKKLRSEEKAAEEKVMAMLDMVGMADIANEFAGSLPYGMQKRIEIVRALVAGSKLLLLDEATAGMNSVESLELIDLIFDLKEKQKLAVIIIEHNMKIIMNVADRIVTMDSGRKIAEGTPAEIQNNPDVIKIYLGEE